jgi:hypothetical protein
LLKKRQAQTQFVFSEETVGYIGMRLEASPQNLQDDCPRELVYQTYLYTQPKKNYIV